MEPPRRAQRVGELAADLRHLPQRHECREREQRQQRQRGRIEAARSREPGAGHDDDQAAEAGGDLLQRRLQREVAQERQPQVEEAARLDGQRLAPPRDAAVGHDLGQALHRVDHVRVEVAGGLARARAEAVDARAAQHRRQRRVEQERHQHQRQRPAADSGQRGQDGQWHQDRHERGRHRVGEEVLDQLDVVGGHADEVAGAATRQVGRGQAVQLAEDVETHVGQEPVGDVVGEPRLDPVQQPGQRRDDPQRDQQRRDRLAALDGAHGQRAQHAHADQRRHPRDAKDERQGEARAIAARLVQQRARHRAPADVVGTQDRIGRLALALRLAVAGAVEAGGGARADRHRAADIARLGGHEPRVDAGAADQRRVRALLDQAALVEHEDPVGADHAGEPVREDERGAADHQAIERRLDQGLALGVDGRERLVEDQDRGVAQERPGDGDALALAAREAHAALADDGGVALRQFQNEVLGVGGARRRAQLVHRGVRLAHSEVRFDGAMEEPGVLADDGDALAHLGQAQLAQVAAADQDAAPGGIVEA